jgi:uncharacterized protein (TIGR02996 family)
VAKKRPPRRRKRTAQDDAFLRAILEAPHDDAPRLVYADWLDDGQSQRAEFVRPCLITDAGLTALRRCDVRRT